jgi:hypothetical protein
MGSDFNDSVNQVASQLQRLAVGAAIMGFSVSLGIMYLYLATQPLGVSNTGMRSSLESICVVLWPSAILMLGAQTHHGGTALFLLSACLNAAYFVLATMLIVALIPRFNFGTSPAKPPAVLGQPSASPISESLRRARLRA